MSIKNGIKCYIKQLFRNYAPFDANEENNKRVGGLSSHTLKKMLRAFMLMYTVISEEVYFTNAISEVSDSTSFK